MTASRFTAAELAAAAKVAKADGVIVVLRRGDASAEVKPVDLPQTEADRIDMMDLRRK